MRFTSFSNVVGVLFALGLTTATVNAQSTDDSGSLETMPSIVTSVGATVIIPTGLTEAPGPVIPSATGSLTITNTGTASGSSGTSVTTTATNSTSTGSHTSSGSSASNTSTTGAGVRSLDPTGVIVAGVLVITGAGALLQF